MTSQRRSIITAANEKLAKLRATNHVGAQLILPQVIFVTAPCADSSEARMQPNSTRQLSGPGSSSDDEEERGGDSAIDEKLAEAETKLRKMQAQLDRIQRQKKTIETKFQAQLQENEKLLSDKNAQGEELTAAVEELKHVTRQRCALAHQLRVRIGGPPEPSQSAASGRELRDGFVN
jgi:septal ring factor EnvC (AmiA/AmiB activator)